MNLPTVAIPKVSEGFEARSLTLIAPIGGILASLLIMFLIVWPKYNQIKELKASNDDLAVRAQSIEEKALTLSSLDGVLLEKQLAAAEAMLPSEKNVFSFIRQIETTAGSTGVLLSRVEAVTGTINDGGNLQVPPAAAAPIPGAESVSTAPKVQARLAVTSSYSSLLQFLSSLYKGARVVTIDDLTVATSGDAQIRASITVDAYWKPLPVDLGSIEKVVVKLNNDETALLESVASEGLSSGSQVPEVPLGRPDLFAPLQ